MNNTLTWMLIALLELGLIFLKRRDNNKLRRSLTNVLLEHLDDNAFLQQITYQSDIELVTKINQQYDIGLTNAMTIAKAIMSQTKNPSTKNS